MSESNTSGQTRNVGRRVAENLADEARSIGALHGSARGERNVSRRIDAMRRLGDLAGGRLLEVGCATGEYTKRLAKNFESVDAIDIELDRLDLFAKTKPDNVQLHIQSVTEMTFEDGSFDVATMIEVLEHLSDPPAALAEVARVLKPGGSLYLTTPNRFWPLEQHGIKLGTRRLPSYAMPGLTWIKPLHSRISNCGAFTKANLDSLASKAGIRLVGVTFMMPPLDSLADGHALHRACERIERTPARVLSQTIVARLERPAAT